MPNGRILIGEDDLFLQQIYKTSLEKQGYEVGVAANGRETLAQLVASQWDLLLLDLNMPEVTGFDVLESMKKDGSILTTPVIILTNFSEEEHAKRCMDMGAKAFYTKSNLSFEDILSQISRLMHSKIGAMAKSPASPAVSGKPAAKPAAAATATPGTAPAAEPATPIVPAPTKTRVLVVEDDPFLSEIYKQNLEERGYDSKAAMSGREAIDTLVADQQWSVVLLDLLMPEMDGFTVLENLREKGIIQKVPIIVLTNLSQENDQKKALELGAVDFAIKSELSFDEIIARVESAMKKWKAKENPPAA